MRTNRPSGSYGQSGGYRDDFNNGYNPRSHNYGHNPYGRQSEVLSPSMYNGLICIVLLYGFVLNYLMVKHCTEFFLTMNLWVLLIGYFVLCLIGIFMSKASDNPVVSFIGYNFVVVPIGAVLSVCLAGVAPDLVKNVVLVTAGVTTVMLVAGTLFPNVFKSIGGALGIALLAVIIIELICGLLLKIIMPTFWDVIVALIFCGYIGFDWAVAQDEEPTADNAIDACVGLYLDIVNLFLRLLSIMGDRDRD